MEFIVNKYNSNKDCWNTYLTNTFKYILCNRPKYAKYLSTIEDNNSLFSFLIYSRLDKDRYSELFKELLISDIYEFNRIQALQTCTIEESIIVYGCNINYFDTILLIMEVIQKCSNSLRRQDINHYIFISLRILLCDILPPAIYDIYATVTDIKMKANIYFILAFCYLNMFEGADIEQIKDFCQSIYKDVHNECNIDSAICSAIEHAPNTKHLQKYNNI